MTTLFLSRRDVLSLFDMAATIEVVEQVFRYWALGEASMPPKSYLSVERGDFRAMPAFIPGAAGLKWVNVHPQNPARGLPTVMGTIIYSDPATGYPLAVMDATDITAYRTGAAAAIASKYLARQDSQTLGIIGAGRQAQTQLLAHAALFKLNLIKVADRIPAAVERFIQAFRGYPVQAASLEEAAQADIVCTVTPAREPILKREWVLPGTHINAIGADAPGKEELEPALLRAATVVVDDIRQASSSGEINVPIRSGVFSITDVYANLGEIIVGKKAGRRDSREITIFDSTGLAIEDIATARVVYERAIARGGFLSMDFVEEASVIQGRP